MTNFRNTVRPGDEQAVQALVAATGFFNPGEQALAAELVSETLEKGAASGYEFLFADADDGGLAGYACFGRIPATQASFDLYWIAVDRSRQRQGLGRELLLAAEAATRAQGGTCMYVDTSGRSQYRPTRAFYERMGYTTAAVLADFYAPGDDKVIYSKRL